MGKIVLKRFRVPEENDETGGTGFSIAIQYKRPLDVLMDLYNEKICKQQELVLIWRGSTSDLGNVSIGSLDNYKWTVMAQIGILLENMGYFELRAPKEYRGNIETTAFLVDGKKYIVGDK